MKQDKIAEYRIDEANILACDMNFRETELHDQQKKKESQ